MSGAETTPAGRRVPVVDLSGAGRFPAVAGAELVAWTRELAADLAPQHDALAIRLVGDRTMRRWNREFRGKDRTTDVLSFPGEASPEGRHLGDVAISVPQADRQARERGHRLDRELRLLILHGLLHCLGYDHEADQGEMARIERRLRRRYLADA